MKNFLPVLIAVVCCAAPAFAGAGAEVEARGAAENPSSFDGARARPGAEPVRPDASADTRTPGEIAAQEQAKADARVRVVAQPVTATRSLEAPAEPAKEPAEQNGPLYGLAGLGVGALFGGLLAVGLSRLNA